MGSRTTPGARRTSRPRSKQFRLKRVYEPPRRKDGCRIRVERLWPRGVSKDKARIDLWLREIAPSHRLRTWFAHDPKKWPGFLEKYGEELRDKQEAIRHLRRLAESKGRLTLLFAAKDEKYNNAVALHLFLTENWQR